MTITTIICNVCNEEIPKVKKKDIFGIEREYYRLGKIEADNYCVQPADFGDFHLCERCAGKISMEIMKFKISSIK